MSEHQIVTEIKGHTGVIKINRPDVYNALDNANKWGIIYAIRDLNENPKVSSIILTAEGKAFCTGQDLNDRQASENEGHQKKNLGDTLEKEWNPLAKSIRSSRKPIIAAINGVTAGAGMSMAMNCDLVTSAPGVKFVGGFGKLALCLDAGSTFLLTKALGEKKVFEFYLTNAPLTAEELKEAGLINHISEQPLEKALELAELLNGCDPIALEVVKTNIKLASESGYNESMENETKGQRLLGSRESFQEGINAFFEKRAPNFRK